MYTTFTLSTHFTNTFLYFLLYTVLPTLSQSIIYYTINIYFFTYKSFTYFKSCDILSVQFKYKALFNYISLIYLLYIYIYSHCDNTH